MKSYHNIETRKFDNRQSYYVGYRKSDGLAVRIYGHSGAWIVCCVHCRTMADVSATLERY
jgi:hypothetical protein